MRIKEMISVGMLFLIISHGIIQFVFLKIFQAKYQAEIVEIMLNDLSETDLVSFKFNKSDLNSGTINIQWLEDDEFRYQNIMYDVFKKEVNGDCVYLYCVQDEKESELYSYFDKYFKKLINEDSDKEEDLESLCYSFSHLYSKPLETEDKSSEYAESKYFTNTPFKILDGVHPSSTPPPRS
ncbi:MAG: hypothetical protein OQJ93_06555 [Ignavibacteriaceae bacterium]|jgi:hypothetical protein|nr:hypothetical protein [Ignavibacteriaceae bacterium]MCW8813326.1 hypothetical protein [Chlorobium sp.]MCW8824566.1 hypothetical protein [Ignavibacteriaceae bacterium]MCW8995245.1 hypothetical protein [Psychromonas sp.]MCW9097031.1 hypothetical protein [Ignavibacteriaceae bacterium]